MEKAAILMRRYFERRTKNCEQRLFSQVWTRYIQNVDQKTNFNDSDEIEIRYPCYRSFSRVWNISGDLCTQTYYSWMKDGFKQFSFICLDRYRNSISKHYKF